MLTLTQTAAEAVKALVAGTDLDDQTGGLRISSSEGAALELALVDGPEQADDAVEALGAHVFLEPAVTRALENKVLDASVEEGQVRFAVFERRDDMGRGPPA